MENSVVVLQKNFLKNYHMIQESCLWVYIQKN